MDPTIVAQSCTGAVPNIANVTCTGAHPIIVHVSCTDPSTYVPDQELFSPVRLFRVTDDIPLFVKPTDPVTPGTGRPPNIDPLDPPPVDPGDPIDPGPGDRGPGPTGKTGQDLDPFTPDPGD